MKSKPQLIKRPNEMFPVGLKYESPDLDEGASVVSCTVTINPSEVDGLEAQGSPQIDGDEVSQVVYGGIDGHNYDVIFKSTTSEGNIFEDSIYVKVREL